MQKPKPRKKKRTYLWDDEKVRTNTIVGVIAVREKGKLPSDYNPLIMWWSVNAYRKDLNDVIDQTEKKGCLSDYEASLFSSCFRKWKEEM